jgi:uncharacterized protein (TIGR02246 family)
MDKALVALVEDYFAAVDRKDVEGCLKFFTPDATFTIATFDVHNRGLQEIRGMFERLFGRYEGIWHGNFRHVVQPPDRIASQFDVANRTAAGEVLRKCNANFFELRDGRFRAVAVYMSGDNALR